MEITAKFFTRFYILRKQLERVFKVGCDFHLHTVNNRYFMYNDKINDIHHMSYEIGRLEGIIDAGIEKGVLKLYGPIKIGKISLLKLDTDYYELEDKEIEYKDLGYLKFYFRKVN